jgi:hypothetical protein
VTRFHGNTFLRSGKADAYLIQGNNSVTRCFLMGQIKIKMSSSECIVSQSRCGFGNPGRETSAVGSRTRGMVWESRPRGLGACEITIDCNCDIAIALYRL